MLSGIWDNIKIALDALRSNKMRSFLTTLAIIMGITTIVAIVSVIDGLNTSVFKNISAIGSSTIYVQKFGWMSRDWEKYRNRRDIGFEELTALETQVTQAEAFTPAFFTGRTVKYEDRKIEFVALSGVSEQYVNVGLTEPSAGRFFSALDVESTRDVAVIGATVADELFGKQNPLGKKIRVGGKRFKVIGILSKRGDFFDMNLDTNVIIPYTTFQKKFGSHRSMSIMIKPVNPADTSVLEDEITAIMRRTRGLRFNEENDFAINKVDALTDLYRKLTGGLYAAMFAVGAISLLVGGIGVMNIMLVSVTERTREIGVRKAIGAKRRHILYQFLVESVTLSMVGGILGVLAGFALAGLVDAFSPVPARVQVWSIFLGLGVSSFTGLFFGIFPAYRASRLDPIEALRYE